MRRTAAEGNDSGRYTEGNPSLGIPATVVGAIEMNNIQEEIVNVILDAGITLDATGSTEDQLLSALKEIMARGGTETAMDLLDNQSSAQDVTAIPAFDKTEIKSAKVMVDVFRRDDGQHANELFELAAIYDPEDDDWNLFFTSQGQEDAGVVFSITAAGQIQYTSTSYAGTNYSGVLRATNLRKSRITVTP